MTRSRGGADEHAHPRMLPRGRAGGRSFNCVGDVDPLCAGGNLDLPSLANREMGRMIIGRISMHEAPEEGSSPLGDQDQVEFDLID